MSTTEAIPSGYCQCGCGQRTNLAAYTARAKGWTKGQPLRFILGHRPKMGRPAEYRIDPTSGCWIWQRSLNNSGYGVTYYQGRKCLAHRAFYEQYVGPIPDGMQLDHVLARGCTSPACVNPTHLEPVTNAENARRGRMAKLTQTDVDCIRESAETALALAERYGVTRTTIYYVRNGKTWK